MVNSRMPDVRMQITLSLEAKWTEQKDTHFFKIL